MYCKYCGSEISQDAVFCGKCGAKVGTETLTESESKEPDGAEINAGKSSFVTAPDVLLLGLFLGYFASVISTQSLPSAFGESLGIILIPLLLGIQFHHTGSKTYKVAYIIATVLFIVTFGLAQIQQENEKRMVASVRASNSSHASVPAQSILAAPSPQTIAPIANFADPQRPAAGASAMAESPGVASSLPSMDLKEKIFLSDRTFDVYSCKDYSPEKLEVECTPEPAPNRTAKVKVEKPDAVFITYTRLKDGKQFFNKLDDCKVLDEQNWGCGGEKVKESDDGRLVMYSQRFQMVDGVMTTKPPYTTFTTFLNSGVKIDTIRMPGDLKFIPR